MTSTTTPDVSDPVSIPGTTPTATPTIGTLRAADFFGRNPQWSEKRFDVADRGQVQGLGTVVASCSRDSGELLELRLSNKFQRLKFAVGQDNGSTGSAQILTVEVVGNNKQIDVRGVPFNTVQDFDISVSGVNALQVHFFLDKQKEGCGRQSVIAVFFNGILG